MTAGRSIGIIGAGRLGGALARVFREAGLPMVCVASRNPERAAWAARFAGGGVRAASIAEVAAQAGVVVITVTDQAIAEVAGELAAAGMPAGVAFHACGAMGPDSLEPLARRGVSCGVLHPLQTVPTPELGARRLRGICWGVTAEGAAMERAREIVAALDGDLLEIAAEARPAYHAAAVMACNYFVAAEDAALAIMESAGVDRERALKALAPIVSATWQNIQECGPEDAATGPLLRGDAGTVRRHLEAVEKLPPTVRGLFRAAGLHTVDIARRRGLPDGAADQLIRLLRDNRVGNG